MVALIKWYTHASSYNSQVCTCPETRYNETIQIITQEAKAKAMNIHIRVYVKATHETSAMRIRMYDSSTIHVARYREAVYTPLSSPRLDHWTKNRPNKAVSYNCTS